MLQERNSCWTGYFSATVVATKTSTDVSSRATGVCEDRCTKEGESGPLSLATAVTC